MELSADYLVIGAGSAGCVLANRLSANPANKVILLEAGNRGPRFWIDMPAGMRFLMGNARADWCFKTEPDPTLDGRVITWPRGKALGGSSAINGLVYVRGDRADYDAWADAGCTGWSFSEVLPYFIKSETFEGEAPGQSHGRVGPLSVSRIRSPHPLSAVFRDACGQLGVAPLDDYCGGDQTGSFGVLTNQRRGRRSSAAAAFLEPVRNRPNLRVLSDCEVEKVLFEGKRAIGARVRRGDGAIDIGANAEVIVCGGTIGSPTILLRSGVGDPAHLQAMGIESIAEVPGVGKNLQEHPLTYGGREVNVPTFNTQAAARHIPGHLAAYYLFGKGLLTSPAVVAMANVKTLPDLPQPDVTLNFIPLAFDVKPGEVPAQGKLPPLYPRPAVRIAVNVCHPYSRGEVRLRDPDVRSAPVIDHRMLGDGRDIDTLIRGLKLIENIFASEAFRPYVVRRLPPELPQSEDQWEPFVRRTAAIGYHPVGTCRMGVGPDAVVDPQLRVRGVTGLRVADASIMPRLVSANTNAAAMMIGEKAADLILS